jgi:hypothetical protein
MSLFFMWFDFIWLIQEPSEIKYCFQGAHGCEDRPQIPSET